MMDAPEQLGLSRERLDGKSGCVISYAASKLQRVFHAGAWERGKGFNHRPDRPTASESMRGKSPWAT